MINVLVSVGKSLFWSFLAAPILMKFAFKLLKMAAARTENKLDDQLVAEAEKNYYANSEGKQ